MLPNGARCTDTPRATTPPTCSSSASQVSATAIPPARDRPEAAASGIAASAVAPYVVTGSVTDRLGEPTTAGTRPADALATAWAAALAAGACAADLSAWVAATRPRPDRSTAKAPRAPV